ncbi:polyketide synthase module [Phyllosticta citribraziliensis]|uniref:Polyketide synthase module n=1 Tax=Phyllosticta citribraziliensis TaxID=989973 RepID=A0ABR1L6H2_9PEZI
MDNTMQILVFGDLAVPYDSGLKRLLSKRDNPTLTSFINEVCTALKIETSALPASQRTAFSRFSTLQELHFAHQQSKNGNCAIDSALVCTYQVASFIAHYSEKKRPYPTKANTYALGSCIGGLAAAAISCSKSVSDLSSTAIEAIKIAFRLGLAVMEMKSRLTPDLEKTSSWSMVVGTTEEKASELVRDFSDKSGLPVTSRPYISSVGHGSVTVTGPPSSLQEFFSQNSQLKPAATPINGPFHASHLYSAKDIENLLDLSSDVFESVPTIPLISNETGAPFEQETYGSLLRAILSESLLKQLRWDRMLEGVSRSVAASIFSGCSVVPFAASGIQGLVSALKRSGLSEVNVDNPAVVPESEAKRPREQSKIAIIGFSGRFPESECNQAFWELLMAGLDVHKEIPKDRFDPKLYFDPTGKKKNTSGVMNGCFIPHPGWFDARFFNMSPREASQADPAQRLVIMTAYEAIEMAGITPNGSPSTQKDRVGVFYGVTSDDYREVNSGQCIDTYFIPGGNRAFIPGRINYNFGFSGPSFSVDTACSSSLAAIHLACNALWRGECDTTIAGGTNVITNPDNFAGLDRGHFLSRTGNCNTFDDGADGYCRADAVGTVILKRLDDALADGDPVFATILGACTNHSAESVSITRPHSGAQEAVFRKILNTAGADPSSVSYVEMHGTGTQHGDAVEMTSVLNVFSPRSDPLYLGSAKSNIGHAESASGVASLIKVLLMMENSAIPPHCGIKTKINHNFPTDLEQRGIRIAMKATDWKRPAALPRRAFVNNFSAAGGNSSVLVEDAPVLVPKSIQDARSQHLVAVSARTPGSLKNNIQTLAQFIAQNPSVSLPSLSYTTTARRIHHNFRVMVSGSDLSAVQNALLAAGSRDKYTAVAPGVRSIFAFTGQGSQYLGMGKQLLCLPQFRADIERFDGIIKSYGFQEIMPIVDGTCTEDLATLPPSTIQLAMACLEMALGKFMKTLGAVPQAVIGHSLGEYAALNLAGVLSDSDTIYLVGKRAQLLEKHCTVGSHSMLSVDSSVQGLSQYLASHKTLEVACINGPSATVLSGPAADINTAEAELKTKSMKTIKLNVQFAFHSAQVQPMLDAYEEIARYVQFKDPSIPLVSPLLGKVITKAEEFGSPARYLSRHCRETVSFEEALRITPSEKAVWVEIGPHTVCSGMIKATLGTQTTTLATLRRGEDAWKTLTAALTGLYERGLDIDWNEYHRCFRNGLTVLRLPSYNWDLKNYWIDYVHDWCLTKGDAPVQALPAPPEPTPAPAPILSSSVHRVLEEKFSKHEATVLAESDIAHPDLQRLLHAHKVIGIAICTSSAWADVALTLAEYMLEKSPVADKEQLGAAVTDMAVERPLIANGQPSQLIRMTATANWSDKTMAVKIYSVNAEGRRTIDHAKCTVRLSNKQSWLNEWKRIAHLIQGRITDMRQGLTNGSDSAHLIKSGMFYKLFGAVVEYDNFFKGHQEAIMRSDDHESTGRVRFQAVGPDAGKWTVSPYWIDSIGQITGFTMNANEATDSKQFVYLNHSWDNLRIAVPFDASKEYHTYVKMQPKNDKEYSGDVFVLHEGVIVAVYEGVTFIKVPRRAMEMALSQATGGAVKASAPAPKIAPVTKANLAAKAAESKPKKASASRRAAPPKTSGASAASQKALAILSEEIGVPVPELDLEEELAAYGIDSLLALNVASKFREDLEIDIDSSVIIEAASIKDLFSKLNLGKQEQQAQAKDPSPYTSDSSFSDADDESDLASVSSKTSVSETESPVSTDCKNSPALMEIVTKLLAEEIGVSVSELTDDEELSNLGLDSLMSLTITSRIREELQIDVDSDFLMTNTTLGSIRAKLAPKSSEPAFTEQPFPPATSVLLQGRPSTATKTLFLFPDGSGSATSYMSLPQLDASIAVYGLNCPFLKRPEDMNCTLRELTNPYLAEIRRRQPHGPYFLGGWSAGGICAYDAAQRLLADGEKVERLLLLDSPNPIGLQKLPERLYDFFDSVDLFSTGGQKAPAWLLPHFLAFIDVLDTYDPVPFADAAQAPDTRIVWALDGVCGDGDGRISMPDPRDDDPREMKWLLNDRTEHGPNGWDQLVPKSKIAIELLEGANHFSMMHGKPVKDLGAFIKNAMA